MNLKEIKALSNEHLLSSFYWIAVRTTNEENSRRGLTKQTSKEERWIIETVIERFNLHPDSFKGELDK